MASEQKSRRKGFGGSCALRPLVYVGQVTSDDERPPAKRTGRHTQASPRAVAADELELQPAATHRRVLRAAYAAATRGIMHSSRTALFRVQQQSVAESQ